MPLEQHTAEKAPLDRLVDFALDDVWGTMVETIGLVPSILVAVVIVGFVTGALKFSFGNRRKN